MPLSAEVVILLDAINKHQPMVAMLAPSFPIVFPYPRIIGKLKRLGFARVVEVSRGAAETNRQLLELLKKNPHSRYITNPCPTAVRFIRTGYPHLRQYLAPTDSPMAACAKIVAREFPEHKIFFIGPCVLKKMEASQDYPELKITALTYKELQQVLKLKKIKTDKTDFMQGFDLIGYHTRLYPISGGLSQSSGLNDLLTDEEYDVVSGPVLMKQALDNFEKNKKLRVLDLLNCDGGCISGPGISSRLSLDQRRLKIIAHWAKQVK